MISRLASILAIWRQWSTLASVLALTLLAGCAVGPNFQRPAAPMGKGYTRQPLPDTTTSADVVAGEAQRFIESQDISHQWWTLFQSPQLNALVEKAFKANPTIPAAKAALRQAQEFVYAQKGVYYPTLQGSYTFNRQNISASLGSPVSSGDTLFNLHTAQLTVGFVPDLLGLNRRQVESLQAQAEFQRFQLEAAYLTLSSNVVAAALQEASLRAQIAATNEIIAANTKSLDLLRRQLALGYAAGLDVAAQESALAAVQEILPPLQKQLDQTRDLLAVLTGRFPSEEMEEKFELPALRLPQELPVSLPSKLVEQRPDVRAAEAQAHAASALIGVAIANMLPQFSISGALGGNAQEFTDMFVNSNPFWSVAGSVTQTLFAGGTLLHRKRAAEAAFEQAAAQYKSTVLTAFQNVADTLYALQHDADLLNKTLAAEQAARKTLDLTQKQQQLGYVNYLSLLSAQAAYQQALIIRVQAQAIRFTDTAALFQALGGGWWNRPDDTAALKATPVSQTPGSPGR